MKLGGYAAKVLNYFLYLPDRVSSQQSTAAAAAAAMLAGAQTSSV